VEVLAGKDAAKMNAMRIVFGICCLGLLMATVADAGQCEPTAGANVLVPVTQAPGKSYSDLPDVNAAGTVDLLQNIWFDGTGSAQDALDYSGSDAQFLPSDEVDALANSQDAYFWDLANDLVPMLVSCAGRPDINYQMAGADITGVWAMPAQINSTSTPMDVDGLEVWAGTCAAEPPPLAHDTNMFSLVGDPHGWSVYRYNPATQTSTGYVASAQIDAAIALGGMPDLDALMVWDSEDNGVWDFGDSLIFSIRPAGQFDGGEVWLWRYGQWASFITHGGERWDTAHPVGLHFGHGFENVNALEAVPEPATLGLLALGGLVLIRRRRS
jgi:hypothetical protein